MASRKRYSIDEEDLTDLLADLELLVVSLDRIGAASEDESKSIALGGQFLIDKAVLKRLAKARHTLSGVFDESATPAAVRRLEARLARQRFWKE